MGPKPKFHGPAFAGLETSLYANGRVSHSLTTWLVRPEKHGLQG